MQCVSPPARGQTGGRPNTLTTCDKIHPLPIIASFERGAAETTNQPTARRCRHRRHHVGKGSATRARAAVEHERQTGADEAVCRLGGGSDAAELCTKVSARRRCRRRCGTWQSANMCLRPCLDWSDSSYVTCNFNTLCVCFIDTDAYVRKVMYRCFSLRPMVGEDTP